ncbi:MAG TPA: hypothetical protein EYG68_01775 [Leucothrix mucor]|nr:hypothetical protein [Leucothrix mucor]
MFLLRLFTLFFTCVLSANAITLTQTVPSDVLFDLTMVAPTNAGDYFANAHTSPVNSTLLSIADIGNGKKWTVYAKLSQNIPGIKVRIIRTGNGIGKKIPQGNTANKILNTNLRKLFDGQGSILNIPMQTEIYGIGVSDGHGLFTSDIEFIVETH